MYIFKTVTDAVTDCDCCGKVGLKRTVVLVDDNGEEKCFGTSCASKALGWTEKKASKKAKETWSAVLAQKKREVQAAKFIKSQAWGASYLAYFSGLFNAGLIKKEWDGTWRLSDRSTFTDAFKRKALSDGLQLPSNLANFCDFCVKTALSK